jgi:LacI family transcriptional regulator, gluconate utilization system Gnt-I transcriptional repressor
VPATAEAGAVLLAEALRRFPDVASGTIFECQRLGLAIPGHLSVVDFGDLSFSAACNLSMTMIRPQGDLIGKGVARLIVARLQAPMGKRSGL